MIKSYPYEEYRLYIRFNVGLRLLNLGNHRLEAAMVSTHKYYNTFLNSKFSQPEFIDSQIILYTCIIQDHFAEKRLSLNHRRPIQKRALDILIIIHKKNELCWSVYSLLHYSNYVINLLEWLRDVSQGSPRGIKWSLF